MRKKNGVLYKSPNKINRSVGIDRKIYKQLNRIKHIMKCKSISKVINLLLRDEIYHDSTIQLKNRKAFLQKINQLITKIGALDEDITGACNNLNQIAYHINRAEYEFRVNNPLYSRVKLLKTVDYQKISKDIKKVQSAKMSVRKLERGANKIWRQLL